MVQRLPRENGAKISKVRRNVVTPTPLGVPMAKCPLVVKSSHQTRKSRIKEIKKRLCDKQRRPTGRKRIKNSSVKKLKQKTRGQQGARNGF